MTPVSQEIPIIKPYEAYKCKNSGMDEPGDKANFKYLTVGQLRDPVLACDNLRYLL